jgi:hypothetical protein
MAGATRAPAGRADELNTAIARGVTAMVVGSSALLAQRNCGPRPEMKSDSSRQSTPGFLTWPGLQPSTTAGVRDHECECLISLTADFSPAAKTLGANLTFGVAREAGTLPRARLARAKIAKRPLVLQPTLKQLLADVRITFGLSG